MDDKLHTFVRQTWWLWLVFLAVTAICSWLIHPIYLFCLPVLVVVFFYFGLIRSGGS
jgi:putative effector of murein hydrolase LrgA (UPF0299 family)